jgi:nucleoside-diphosphate-sugar epimerase
VSEFTQHVLVAGGAGFLGSHLCGALLDRGHEVTSIDNFSTGSPSNIVGYCGNPRFRSITHDVTQPFAANPEISKMVADSPPARICNLASPASPPAYMRLAIETLDAGSAGTKNLLDLAVSVGARFLQASTSEVYGDPDVHPQPESYWGRVNPNGPRSMYDESKRFAEALCAAYVRQKGLDLRTVRIFNTYGPKMAPGDGRVVSNFIGQALQNLPLTIFGDGQQTRSFCYVDDEVAGILALLDSDVVEPVNIGNPHEFTVAALATLVVEMTDSRSRLEFLPAREDDPVQRCPDISRAVSLLGWTPQTDLRTGLHNTTDWFRSLAEFAPAASKEAVRALSGPAV